MNGLCPVAVTVFTARKQYMSPQRSHRYLWTSNAVEVA
jgi:hypothetical protein